MIPVTRKEIGEDVDVERKRPETEETNAHRIGVDERMLVQHPLDAVDDRAQLVRSCFVTKPDDRMKPEFVARKCLQVSVRELTVGHADDGAIERPDARLAQADMVHGSDNLSDFQRVSDANGLIEDD